MHIEAYQIAEDINLKKFRNDYTGKPLLTNSAELFYTPEDGRYFFLTGYGSVVFAGFNDVDKSNLLKFLKDYLINPIANVEYYEDIEVILKENTAIRYDFQSITVPELSENVLHVIMLNMAQSVVLDYFEDVSYDILDSTKKLTRELQYNGKLTGSRKALLQFVGRTMSVKNSIVENLYIFDVPDIVWESENLDKIDEYMKRYLDIRTRYQDIEHKLEIVKDNLTLFTDILQNRESTRLEWIVIILILIEVIHLFVK